MREIPIKGAKRKREALIKGMQRDRETSIMGGGFTHLKRERTKIYLNYSREFLIYRPRNF